MANFKERIVSFNMYGIRNVKFKPCSIQQARKALGTHFVVFGLSTGYHVFDTTSFDQKATLEDFNNCRLNTSKRVINGCQSKYAYFVATLSFDELDNQTALAAAQKENEEKLKQEQQYQQDVALGKVDYDIDRIYTDGKKGSLTFFLNGKEFRLLGISTKPNYYCYKQQKHIFANRHEMHIFEQAYRNGEFKSIGYTHMTKSGEDVYLSTCT